MRNELQRVLELQPLWSNKNTTEMQERGTIVRRTGRTWLESMADAISSSIGISSDDLIVEGSDGVGQKTELPWLRFGSRSRSSSATEGWYCVYLFATNGSECYLSLAHGSTVWNGSAFVPRPLTELQQLAAWGRKVVAIAISNHNELSPTMSLQARRTNLGPAYEAGTAICRIYERDLIPDDLTLSSDVLFFASLLGDLYREEDSAPAPVGPAPEIVEALEDADRIAGKHRPARARGQGFRLNSTQRTAIEKRAMKLAEEHLLAIGWNVKDTSTNKPYDFHCTSSNGELYVEVKGTTSNGEKIILTRGEVEHHQSVHPNNALIIVSGIELVGSEREQAEKGNLRMISPWDIAQERLTVVTYTYDV